MGFFSSLLRIIAIILLIIAIIFLIWYALTVGIGAVAASTQLTILGVTTTYGGLLVMGLIALTLSIIIDPAVFGSVVKRLTKVASAVVKAAGSILSTALDVVSDAVLSSPLGLVALGALGIWGYSVLTDGKDKQVAESPPRPPPDLGDEHALNG